jgi:hypothetical protein
MSTSTPDATYLNTRFFGEPPAYFLGRVLAQGLIRSGTVEFLGGRLPLPVQGSLRRTAM